jgi:hypothetical protein
LFPSVSPKKMSKNNKDLNHFQVTNYLIHNQSKTYTKLSWKLP